MSYKQNPFGLHSVTPYLVVPDAASQIKFIELVLDGEVRGETTYHKDGSVRHIEVVIGDSVVMMGEPMDDLDPMPAMLYTYVDDCDAAYQKAIEAGASSVLPPDDYPHGDRYGGVRDHNGNVWWLVTHLSTGQSPD